MLKGNVSLKPGVRGQIGRQLGEQQELVTTRTCRVKSLKHRERQGKPGPGKAVPNKVASERVKFALASPRAAAWNAKTTSPMPQDPPLSTMGAKSEATNYLWVKGGGGDMDH